MNNFHFLEENALQYFKVIYNAHFRDGEDEA